MLFLTSSQKCHFDLEDGSIWNIAILLQYKELICQLLDYAFSIFYELYLHERYWKLLLYFYFKPIHMVHKIHCGKVKFSLVLVIIATTKFPSTIFFSWTYSETDLAFSLPTINLFCLFIPNSGKKVKSFKLFSMCCFSLLEAKVSFSLLKDSENWFLYASSFSTFSRVFPVRIKLFKKSKILVGKTCIPSLFKCTSSSQRFSLVTILHIK